MSIGKIPECLLFLSESGISDDTLQLLTSNPDLLLTLIDNASSCEETIRYLKGIGVDLWMIEELMRSHNDLFFISTAEVKALMEAAAMRRFVEDMSEYWDEYFCVIFEHLKKYSEPYRDLI